MINISNELKNSFKLGETERKVLSLDFHPININITNTNIVSESLKLVEKINSEEDLAFGSCIASEASFTVFGVSEELKGNEVTITLNVSETDIPLGHFIVDSANKQDDKRFKDVVAYDRMRLIDTDVSDWYKGLFSTGSETYTLSQLRSSLLSYVGIEEDELTSPLPNDDMIVEHTISPSQISGRVVIEACEELNGCFGHMNRNGKFVHVVLKPMHIDYPQNDYPKDDYPLPETYDEIIGLSQKVKYEEYSVNPIDRIQIRKEENDIGAIYGEGTNTYIIQDNFLVYGKSAEELQKIAQNASVNIFGRGYRPYSADVPGLPYIEVGDYLKYDKEDSVAGHLLERTLKGVQSLKDSLVAKGEKEQTQGSDKNTEIIELKGKAAIIEKSVEVVKTTIYDLELKTETIVEQTAEMVSIEATRAIGAEGELRGSITATSEQINLEVSRATQAEENISSGIDLLAGKAVIKARSDGTYASVELDADPNSGSSIKWKADSLIMEGLVTVNGNFKILADGSIEAVNARFSGEIVGSTIRGSRIEVEGSGVIQSTNWDGTSYGIDFDELILSIGKLVSRKTRYFNGGQSHSLQGEISGGIVNMYKVMCNVLGDDQNYIGQGYIANLKVSNNINASSINGYGVVHDGNIGDKSVNYSTYSGSANSSGHSDNSDYASSAGYATSAGSASPTYHTHYDLLDNGSAIRWNGSKLFPWSVADLGDSSHKYGTVYANTPVINTSDRNDKNSIEDISDVYKVMIERLNPVRYKFNNGTSGRYHLGFIAQEVEELMSELKVDSLDFAGFIKSPVYEEMNEDGSYDSSSEIKGYAYALRYSEFIAPIVSVIQSLIVRVNELESKLDHGGEL